MKTDLFFMNDPYILSQRLREILPTGDMTIEEKLNSIARFSIYLTILLMIVYKNFNMIYIAIITLVLLALIYHYAPDLKIFKSGSPFSYMDNKLQLPTPENPFMNVLMTDYTDNPNKKPAADVDNPLVKEEISKHFNAGLYRDANDIWNKDNSQRQYYSTPSTTIPNDRDGFMNWCYNTPYNCKEGDLSKCIYDARELSVTEITKGPVGPVPVNRH